MHILGLAVILAIVHFLTNDGTPDGLTLIVVLVTVVGVVVATRPPRPRPTPRHWSGR